MSDRYQVVETANDDLRRLLAIDYVCRFSRHDSLADDIAIGEIRFDDNITESDIDEPLAVALAGRWRQGEHR